MEAKVNHKMYFLSLLFLFFIYSNSFSQYFNDEKRVVVNGEIETMVPADNATFTFEVSGKGSTLSEAVRIVKNKVALISKNLFDIGLQKKNLRTSFFDSRENFGNKSFWSSKDDFKAQMEVLISIDSLELLEPAILKVSEFKPDKISKIQFSLINYENLKITALEAAVNKAKEKAHLLSKNMNTKLGNVLFIEESINNISPQRNSRSRFANASLMFGKGGKQIEEGNSFFTQQLKIRVKVRVIIELAGSNFE